MPLKTPDATPTDPSRRRFVTGMAAGVLGLATGLGPRTYAGSQVQAVNCGAAVLSGNQFKLDVGYLPVNFTGRERLATAINGGVPGPLLHWREGDRVTIEVSNHLAHDTSIHWHGLVLPTNMDGVPGISFPGIKPGGSFTYTFELQQSGTYWYHSHSGFQEQTGHYGAIVIHPRAPEPFSCDRDYVILLSDWSDEEPRHVYAKLKKFSHYYVAKKRTVGDLWRDLQDKGLEDTWKDRAMWNHMRMNDRDISDVTGLTYTFLMNGCTPADGWTGMFKPGEKIRLRFINAAAMTFFDVRIPGLKMKVVAADGQPVQPVSVDDIRLGVAETYDVLVEPEGDVAYCVFAQAIDRSGYARGTLTPAPGLSVEPPPMDPLPVLTHADMGMAHDTSARRGHSATEVRNNTEHPMDHSTHTGGSHGTSTHQTTPFTPGLAGYGSSSPIIHGSGEFGPQVDMLADRPLYRLDDPGPGLRQHSALFGRKVLTYADLRHLHGTPDPRQPGREIQLHLTGNMARYMWSFDGVKHADAQPLIFKYGERLRITLVNDTMMNHPIHLHGMWSDLETGDGDFLPRKHTVVVQPGAKISYLVTADARGAWAYHCHLLYHMMGMFREVHVI